MKINRALKKMLMRAAAGAFTRWAGAYTPPRLSST